MARARCLSQMRRLPIAEESVLPSLNYVAAAARRGALIADYRRRPSQIAGCACLAAHIKRLRDAADQLRSARGASSAFSERVILCAAFMRFSASRLMCFFVASARLDAIAECKCHFAAPSRRRE